MTLAEKITNRIKRMPESEQAEVLDFVEYLATKARDRRRREEAEDWSHFSLASAMEGMADETEDYLAADLKEVF